MFDSIVTHAERELTHIGWLDHPYDHLSDAMARGLIECIRAFSSMGHSGASREIAIPILVRLLEFRALSPLTDDPDEWEDVSHMSGMPMWQNHRDSSAFSEDGGKTYYFLDEIPPGEYSDAAPVHTSLSKAEVLAANPTASGPETPSE